MTTTGLQRLNTWVKAKEFALKIYRQVLPLLPVEENIILVLKSEELLQVFRQI